MSSFLELRALAEVFHCQVGQVCVCTHGIVVAKCWRLMETLDIGNDRELTKLALMMVIVIERGSFFEFHLVLSCGQLDFLYIYFSFHKVIFKSSFTKILIKDYH